MGLLEVFDVHLQAFFFTIGLVPFPGVCMFILFSTG